MSNRTSMPPPVIDNFIETPLGLFLNSHRATEKGDACSFTGMGQLRGRYMVKDEEYPHFLDLLHEYLFTQLRRPLNLVEQRRCDWAAPILIDLDFKYPAERAIQRQFEIQHVHTFIRDYVENIAHFYDLEDCKPLRFFITLRPAPYEDKKATTSRAIKDGVHIQCPDLILNSEHQQVLRHRSLERSELGRSFSNTGYINSEKDIFDEAIVKKNGWFFYGESKPDIPAYQLASVYVYSPETNSFHEEDIHAYESRQLIELLSIRYNLRNEPPPFRKVTQEEWKDRLDYCMGRKSNTTGIIAVEEKQAIELPTIHITSSNVYEQMELDTIALAKQLAIECLSADRASGYATWLAVGMCLHHIDPSEEMFQTWMEFSNKSGKAAENNQGELFRQWKTWGRSSQTKQYTERSLHKWAKEDNPKKYKYIMNDNFIDFVEREVDNTHTHIARLMKRMYKNNYCASVDAKKVEWYQFTGTCWKKLPQGIELRNKMTTDVAQVISETRSRIRKRMTDGDQRANNFEEPRMKKLLEIERSLYQSGFKDAVMKDCIGLFYEEDFAQKLNANQYLIGFNNGVIDLHALKEDGSYTVNFRNAEPTDFITFMAGRYATKGCEAIDYVPYDPTDKEQAPIHAAIDDFMAKLFPKQELRAYMWKKLASCIEGANKEQTYETWIGVGGNGKSKLVDLMSMVLGDYASSLQSTAMTRKRPESGAANPDIMAIRNKRFIYMAEPDDREPLNTSRMKQFTGEDDVEARGLFEDQTKFKITGKIFMLCNAFPAINTMDRGTWRRVQAVPFESKFVDTGVEEAKPEEHIYPRDPKLDANLTAWRTLFMSRLVHIYKTEYLPKGLGSIPAIVKQESNKYQETFDAVGKFMNERVRIIKSGGYDADIKDIFRAYKLWQKETNTGRCLTQNELYRQLSDKCGEPSDKKTFKQFHAFKSDAMVEEYDATGMVTTE